MIGDTLLLQVAAVCGLVGMVVEVVVLSLANRMLVILLPMWRIII